jgi:hypothetical protein
MEKGKLSKDFLNSSLVTSNCQVKAMAAADILIVLRKTLIYYTRVAI